MYYSIPDFNVLLHVSGFVFCAITLLPVVHESKAVCLTWKAGFKCCSPLLHVLPIWLVNSV